MVYFQLPQLRSKNYPTKQSYWATLIGVLVFFVLFFVREYEAWLELFTNDTELVAAIALVFLLLAPPTTFLVVLLPSILGGKFVHLYYKKSSSQESVLGLLIGFGIGVLIGVVCSPIGTLFYGGQISNLLLNGALAGGLAGFWYSRKLRACFLQEMG